MIDVFIQDNRVFTCAPYSFIRGCLLSMDTVPGIQSKLHQMDTKCTSLEIKVTCSAPLSLTM